MIFIFWGHFLNTHDKSFLSKGLNSKWNLLLYGNIDSLNVSHFHHARVLARLLRRTHQKTNLSPYYACKMKYNDRSKFQIVCEDQEKVLNSLIHMKKIAGVP